MFLCLPSPCVLEIFQGLLLNLLILSYDLLWKNTDFDRRLEMATGCRLMKEFQKYNGPLLLKAHMHFFCEFA